MRKNKTARKDNSNLVGGVFRPNTSIAKIFEVLEGGKPKPLTQLKKLARGVSLEGRLYVITKRGFKLVKDKDKGTVKLVGRKGKVA